MERSPRNMKVIACLLSLDGPQAQHKIIITTTVYMDYILLCYCSNGTGKVEGDNMWQIEKASHPVHIVRLDECLSAKGLAQFCCLPIPEHTADDMAIISLFIP